MTEPSSNVIAEALATFHGKPPSFVDGVWVNEAVQYRDFKYYIFDWDDNIISMPTRIHLERLDANGNWVPHPVSTAAYSVIRKDMTHFRPPQNLWENAFVEFQDLGVYGSGRFISDLNHALDGISQGHIGPSPSFNTFRQTLIEGRLFAIVTARGHAPEILRNGVELFIDRVLTPVEREVMLINLRGYRYCYDKVATFPSRRETLTYYLSLNRYHAVTSPNFDEMMREGAAALKTSEARKQFAIRDFVNHIIHILQKTGVDALSRPVSVGFSDDDVRNVEAIKSYIQTELSHHFPSVKFCVYDTSDTESGARKVLVSRQMG